MDMPLKRLLVLLIIAAFLLSGCVTAVRRGAARFSNPEVTVTGDASKVPPGLTDALKSAVKDGRAGITLIVMRGDQALYRIDAGNIRPDAQYEIASSSKWMAAALVMTVVDEGKLALDDSISKWLPEFQGDAGTITLRELLAQTAGQGGLKSAVDRKQSPRMTLAQSAAEIARIPLQDKPGTVFKYGGPGFQVAGALVEQVTGKQWADLFDERIAQPLGMSHTYWEHLPTRGVIPDDTHNPLLQGGAVSSAGDYMRFLGMLAGNGVYAGRRVLSEQAVAEMEKAQTLGKPMAWLPPGIKSTPGLQYALGNWCERMSADGDCTLVSSPGAFGTYPWIDRRSGLYGVFFTKTRLPKVVDDLLQARTLVLSAQAAGSGTAPSP